MMSFLTAVVNSCYPTTNNQLRNSLNPRHQATINDGRVILQPIQGIHTSFAAGTTMTYTPGASGSNSGKQRTVICYNCKGEGHMSKQCTKPKRKQDDSWFKDKVLLVQAQANGQILHEEELEFLADLGIAEVALMVNLSHYGSDALAKVHNHDNVNNNMINQVVQAMSSSKQSNVVNHSETEITSDSNIIPYSQTGLFGPSEAVEFLQNPLFSSRPTNLRFERNERLLEQVINNDIVNIIMNSSVDIASVNVNECEKCLKLETELLNKKDFVEKEIYDKLFKSFTTLEKHCISLEVDTQLNQEIFQRDNSVSNQSAPSFDQLFELNELKA
ncbi:retrovirus-related pol polyprotein from transposon TNT 1-94 [Tanacetum coccineum]